MSRARTTHFVVSKFHFVYVRSSVGRFFSFGGREHELIYLECDAILANAPKKRHLTHFTLKSIFIDDILCNAIRLRMSTSKRKRKSINCETAEHNFVSMHLPDVRELIRAANIYPTNLPSFVCASIMRH